MKPSIGVGIVGIALGVLFAVGCAAHSAQPAATATTAANVPKQFREHQIVVALGADSRPRWAKLPQDLQTDYGLRQTGEFPLTSIGVQCLVFEVPREQQADAVLAKLSADARVALAQPNQLFTTQATVHSDPYASLQYGAELIHATRAHGLSTGRGVKVAVVDTGVDQEHPDLQGHVEQTANFVEGGERSFNQDRHGTSVAGIIAARADNGVGIFGIAPEADILAAKACWYATPNTGQALCSSWTLAKAVDFAINSGAQVLNMSLAGPADPLLTRLLAAANDRHIIVVAAAFERGNEPGFPASLPPVIAVVAGDAHGLAHPPAWARVKPPVAAPGAEILTTIPATTYDFQSGSSLAAAHVSGVVALLLQRKPDLSPGEVYALLQASARPASSTPDAIHLVDACAALDKLLGEHTCE